MKKIARENTQKFIREEGRKGIIAIVFRKKDGRRRKMSLRVGVKKNLKGGVNKVESIERSYVTVFDMNKGNYRTINLRTLESITARGDTYQVI